MKKEKTIYDYIAYTLFGILIFIILFNFFKIIYHKMTYIPPNSINVSPITGERIEPVYNSEKTPVEVTYIYTENLKEASGLSDANIIYEYLDGSNSLVRKAIFYDKVPKNNYPVNNIDNISLSSLPKFKFLDTLDVKDFPQSAKYIFVNFNNDISSNFIFEDGLYYHFQNTFKNIDKESNKQISVSNIIVQYVDKKESYLSKDITGSGEGVLFCGGKIIKIKWNKDSNPIKITDEKGNPVSIIRGNTWWILLKNDNSVIYK